VSRDVARHGGRPAYCAHDADRRAWVSALRPKRCLLAGNRRLREVVASKLILDWSPEQISGWLKTRLSQQREYARVPRDYLSQPVHSSARSIEERADGPSAVEAAHAPVRDMPANMDTLEGRSSMPSQFESDLRRQQTEPFPATGKAICSPVERTATLRRWWSGIHASSC